VYESESDRKALQELLDRSDAAAGEQLRSIITAARRLRAEQVVDLLRGVFVLNLATVTARGEPLVAPVDGVFFRGRVWFGLPPGSVRGRHVRARPQVSAVYQEGEESCVIVHGRAREVDLDAAEGAEALAYFREVYGRAWDYWHTEHYKDREGRGWNGWIEARRMFAMGAGG
jgi:nitroimidazol reductase NimA-like FMN-containing flavoprotein (pyridoxamine 5'-phosphate oxidase superfamily)